MAVLESQESWLALRCKGVFYSKKNSKNEILFLQGCNDIRGILHTIATTLQVLQWNCIISMPQDEENEDFFLHFGRICY